ncbi:MAG TPA: hypothetical protein VLB83_02275 [Candidatus Paceibacterota bacterium]|nr:hypothetical protein [Candidatus Paceibacterota bacterium]
MKKRLADDPKSWGKQEGSGQATAAPTPEQSGLPKPLTLADIRVGEEYVTLGRHPSDGRLYSRLWKVVGVPRPHGGIMEIDVQVATPGGVGMPTSIFAHLYGLGRSFPHNNDYHAFHATPETVALIEGIVERQDHVEYAAIIKEQIPPRDELVSTYWDAPTPPEISNLMGKGVYQSLDVFERHRVLYEAYSNPPAAEQKSMLLLVNSEEADAAFLQRFAELLKTKG